MRPVAEIVLVNNDKFHETILHVNLNTLEATLSFLKVNFLML